MSLKLRDGAKLEALRDTLAVDGVPITCRNIRQDGVKKQLLRYIRKRHWKNLATEHDVDELNQGVCGLNQLRLSS